jgi:integrase
MAAKIDTVTGRAKLKPRRDPYWHRLSQGCYVGVRKMAADSPGAWLARAYVELDGKQTYKPLGGFDHLPDHQRFDAASVAAREWFEHLGRGGSAQGSTIKDVCERYVRHVRETKSELAALDADARFKSYVLDTPAFAATDVSKLTPAIIDQWRRALRDRPTTSGSNRGQQRHDSTLNRDMTCFRAALNLALDDGLVTSDFAWRVKLRPIPDADRRRELYLDRDQRRKLIQKAQPDVAQLLTALSLLPLRPGALAALTVGNFDKRLGVIVIPDDKAGKGRRIKLPAQTIEFFVKAAADKLPAAPLLSRADGAAWNKDMWKAPVKAAVQAAKLPKEATAYTLRHSVITDLVHGGLDLLTVAQVAGTSVRMIERHYGHLRDTVAADALARLAL